MTALAYKRKFRYRKEAKVTYTAALTAIERLPTQRRRTRAVVTLENRLRLLVEPIITQ